MYSIDNYSFDYNYKEQNSIFLNEKPTSYSDGNIHQEIDKNNNELKKKEIPNEKKDKKEKKEKIKPGKKRERENKNKSEHTKFSNDNIRRKIKSLLLRYILIFVNKKIYSMYDGNIGHGIFKMQLKTLEQSQVSDATIRFNKELLKKTLREILSKNISGKYTNLYKDYNKFLINTLINEEDENKRKYFKSLFNLTFTDCLKQFRGDQKLEVLEGLELFDDIKEIKFEYLNKYEDGDEYIKKLKHYLKNYENIINGKKLKKIKGELEQNN